MKNTECAYIVLTKLVGVDPETLDLMLKIFGNTPETLEKILLHYTNWKKFEGYLHRCHPQYEKWFEVGVIGGYYEGPED